VLTDPEEPDPVEEREDSDETEWKTQHNQKS
jgi:hypothetical protein